MPRGIVIPWVVDGQCRRLTIHRPNHHPNIAPDLTVCFSPEALAEWQRLTPEDEQWDQALAMLAQLDGQTAAALEAGDMQRLEQVRSQQNQALTILVHIIAANLNRP